MKTLIIGMGNIGVIHGWFLSQNGVDITHVVRKGSLARCSGVVKMDILDMRGDSPKGYLSSYLPKVVDEAGLNRGYELVSVATHHLQAAGALQQYRHLVKEADFLLFTANWEGTGEIDALIPRSRYLWGFSVSSGARDADGILYANIQKQYRIGELDGLHTPRLDKIMEMFERAGLMADVKPDIIRWQWVHHAINAGIIGTALNMGGLPGGDSDRGVWLIMVRAVKDVLAVLEKRGVDIESYVDTKPFLISDEEDAAGRLRLMMLGLPHYERTRKQSHFNTSPIEMKRFYLDILETGGRLGVPMPYLGSLKTTICRSG